MTAARYVILHRADLSVQERADHIAEWVRLTGQKPPQDGEVSGGRGKRGGIMEAARVLPVEGKTEKAREHNIRRALDIADIPAEAQRAAEGAGITSQAALLEIAKAADPLAKAAEISTRKTEIKTSSAPQPLQENQVDDQGKPLPWMSRQNSRTPRLRQGPAPFHASAAPSAPQTLTRGIALTSA